MPEDNETYDMGSSEASDMALLLQANEDKILNASIKAMKSGSLTTLVKEELRYTIQSRRLAAGKGELKLEEFKKPPKRKPVTDEERKRAQVRRLQNREAAQRFRQKQKDQASYLTEKIKRLEKSSGNLMNDMARLREERDELSKMLYDHLAVCTSNIPMPDSIYPNRQQLQIQSTHPSTSSDNLAASPSHCPNTSDSTSSVFFPEEASNSQGGNLMYGNMLQDLDISSIEIIQHSGSMLRDLDISSTEIIQHNGSMLQNLDISSTEIIQHNGNMLQDLMDTPEMGQEMIIGDIDMLDSLSEHSDENRIDSCSSFETASNFGSVSSEGYSLTDSTSELSSSLAATVSLVHVNHINIHEFDNPFSTDDILLLDDMTS